MLLRVPTDPDTLALTLCVTDSIDAQDLEAWREICCDPTDPYMHPSFIRALERSMAGDAEIRSLLFRDKQGRPVAAACISRYHLDAAMLAGGWARKLIDGIRRLFPRYLCLRCVYGGLPFSNGQSQIRFAPGADRVNIAQQLDEEVRRFATESKSHVVVYKEFDDAEMSIVDSLASTGYLKAEIFPMNRLDTAYDSFTDYCAAMTSRYRYPIRKSIRKFSQTDLRVEHHRGGAAIDVLYSDDVHQLYHNVLDNVDGVLEVLPAEFTHELARQFGEDFYLMLVYRDDRVVGCLFGVFASTSYYPFLIGIDYEVNRESDLYFNIFYNNLEYAMQRGVTEVVLGHNADRFKASLGARQERRYCCVRVTGLLSLPFRLTSKWMLGESEMIEPLHVFKDPRPADKA